LLNSSGLRCCCLLGLLRGCGHCSSTPEVGRQKAEYEEDKQQQCQQLLTLLHPVEHVL
jgi:hypothetical protein